MVSTFVLGRLADQSPDQAAHLQNVLHGASCASQSMCQCSHSYAIAVGHASVVQG